MPFHGPKKSRFSGPTPSNAPRNDVALLKTIMYRAIKTTGTLIVILPQSHLESWRIISELTNKPEEEDEDLCFYCDLAPTSVYPHLHILVQPNNEHK